MSLSLSAPVSSCRRRRRMPPPSAAVAAATTIGGLVGGVGSAPAAVPSLRSCLGGQAPAGQKFRAMQGYTRMVERSCHWNCYRPDTDFFPPAPPKYWTSGLYSAQACADWCDSLPGCTGFEYPTGCDEAAPACAAYPDKAVPGSYCGLFFRGVCSSSASPGFHVSPGFDTYVRSRPAAPVSPYYSYAEQLAPTPWPEQDNSSRQSARGARLGTYGREAELPRSVRALLSMGRGFRHLEELLEMQLNMQYPIFFNATALSPDFPSYEARVPEPVRRAAWEGVRNLTKLFGAPVANTFAGWTVAAGLLLMLQLYDQTHEVVLGNQPLLPQEMVWDWLRTFQAHPDDYWLYRPMSAENHYLHAILHRIEGHRLGEAGLIGFENAKFWFAGGVEKPAWGLGVHPVYKALAAAGSEIEVLRRCCVRDASSEVWVPPGRWVRVAPGWDPFAFVDFHRSVVESTHPQEADVAALRWAQRFEFENLFNYSVGLALDGQGDPYLSGKSVQIPVTLRGHTYKLWAQRWGEGPIKILLVHGGPGCGHVALDPLTGLLSPFEYELIFFDQLGSERSDCFDPESSCHDTMPTALSDYVEQIEQVRQAMALKPEATILFGHSWGVMLTIEYALRYEGNVHAYVLAGFPASIAAQMRRMAALANMHAGDFFSSFICRRKPCPARKVFATMQCNEDLDRRLLWSDGGFACRGVLCDWNREEDIQRITAPALLLVGEFDLAAPSDVSAMAARMPRATFAELLGAGHLEFVDAAEGFLAHFSAWIRESAFPNGHVAEQALFAAVPPQRQPLAALAVLLVAATSAAAGAMAFTGGHGRWWRAPAGRGVRDPMLQEAA